MVFSQQLQKIIAVTLCLSGIAGVSVSLFLPAVPVIIPVLFVGITLFAILLSVGNFKQSAIKPLPAPPETAVLVDKAFEKHTRETILSDNIIAQTRMFAHDLNNVSGAISGYADLMRRHYPDDTRIQRYAEVLITATNRMSGLIVNLRAMGTQFGIFREEFEVSKELTDVKMLLQRLLKRSIHVELTHSLQGAMVVGDAAQFRNALITLAMNANDAMPEGGTITLSGAMVVVEKAGTAPHGTVRQAGTYVAIVVSDTGKGMSEKTLERLFEPYLAPFKFGENRKLGIAGVVDTMSYHQGYIAVKSKIGEGTSFTLYFPGMQTKKDAQLLQPAALAPAKPLLDLEKNILMADDDPSMQDAVTDMLQLLGCKVTACVNGAEALDAFRVAPDSFDLVVLDMNMPVMSGVECFREIKKIRNDTPSLIMTGYGADATFEELKSEGVGDVIQKPFLIEDLGTAINRLIAPGTPE